MRLFFRNHIFGTTRPIFTKFFMHVTYGRGSVLLWRRWYVMYFRFYGWRHICSWADVARHRRPAEAQCTRSLGLGYKMCTVIPAACQRTHGTTFRALKVISRWQYRRRSLPSMTALLILFIVVWPTMSCLADWSKCRHVTFIVIEWSTRHGRPFTMIHGHVTFTKCKHKIYSALFLFTWYTSYRKYFH